MHFAASNSLPILCSTMNTKIKKVPNSSAEKNRNLFNHEIFRNFHFWVVLILGAISVLCVGPLCISLWNLGNNNKVSTNVKIVQDWEQIANVQIPEKFFVYSAFYDYLGGDGIIKILGATIPTTQRQLYCHLYDKGLNHYETVGATIQVTRHASRQLPMSPVTIFCKLSRLQKLPSFVSLSPKRVLPSHKNDDDTKIIPVNINNLNDLEIDLLHPPKKGIQFAACIQPTYDYDDVWQLLQWIEFQMLMGVEHFTFYNISIGPSASCLIQHYNNKFKADPLISILPWQNIHKIPELHNNGQVIQATDCAARYKNIAKFVVILDFDEYILPRRDLSHAINNYQDLIQFSLTNVLNSSNNNHKGMFPVQFQFRSGLFGLGFPEFSNEKENSKLLTAGLLETKIGKKLSLLKHITRLKQIKPFHDRAKFITMPEFVNEPGIHSMVHATPRNGIELLIPETVAYVHHYRNCSWATDCGGGKEILEDKTGHFWAKQLLPKVMTRYQQVGDLCGIQL